MNKEEVRTLARFMQKFEDYEKSDNKWKERIEKQFEKLNGQVRKNTNFRWKVIGMGIIISMILGGSVAVHFFM